jgi:putative ATP-dependent endonuclease of OLD family
MSSTANILRLRIVGFRGLKFFDWRPPPGMNVILGGGDVGKTTILDALALLLSPSNSTAVAEADYWQRDTDSEFVIEATVSLPETAEIENQKKMSWPWNWNGQEAVLPESKDGSDAEAAWPVYVIRVRGTADLEPSWEVVQPSGEVEHLSVAVRRKIGLVRLSSDERNDRDLRLVYGSALDRLLADNGLRARIGKTIAAVPLLEDEEKPRKVLAGLEQKMEKNGLPTGLKLGLTSSQGLSIGALIGILAVHEGVHLPLSNWGAGTRRMAALEVAAATASHASITTIDEIERGLEPYRLRKLLSILEETAGQVFLTTHSAVAISCVSQNGHLWYLDNKGNIGHLPAAKIGAQQRRDPETFLAKLAVVGEGETEVGFLRYLLTTAFGGDPLIHGVRVCDGQGNNAVLDLLQTLADANLDVAALVDDEGKDAGSWSALKVKMGDRLYQWQGGCSEKHVISAIPDDKLIELLTNDEDGKTGYRLRSLADRLGIEKKDIASIEAVLAAQMKTLKELIIEAASGSTVGAPDKDVAKAWKKHAQDWFKAEEGGEELAKKMVACGAWPTIQAKLLPLVNAVLFYAKRPTISGLAL